uniref:Uncharacterized protein n=1 Tax=Romanomermis culicivorax TaxID=13658 RepID=A0A915J2Q7_ROMCU
MVNRTAEYKQMRSGKTGTDIQSSHIGNNMAVSLTRKNSSLTFRQSMILPLNKLPDKPQVSLVSFDELLSEKSPSLFEHKLRLYSLPRSVDFINVAIFTFTDFSFSCLGDVKGVFHLAQMEEITVRKSRLIVEAPLAYSTS